ncbi:major facilitator superfamily domain-containing protein 9-like [Euwallacea fornicatus]|uniref:major facilitator superfamily domain-containing protein 9-like n=1 Tax=Euwallacea fornicatus TaxID=995702 RepID=UPI00338EBA74
MSTEVAIRNLQVIVALDSLSYGLIYCFISPYILKLGGSHVEVGLLTIGNVLADLLSPELCSLLTHQHGKKFTLFLIFNAALLSHLLLVLTNSYWFAILVRILISLTNQTQNLCLELLLNKADSEENKKKIRTNYSIFSGSGYILGPIISGYVFDFGFGYIGIIAACLAFINSRLLVAVNKDDKDANSEYIEGSVVSKAYEKVMANVQEFRKCKPEIHWDLLVVKYLFAGSIIIFFSKFTQILKHNFHSSSVVIGYTTAYINGLIFAITYYADILKIQKTYSVQFISEISFLLLSVLMLLACYAPYYEVYIVMLALVIILRVLVFSLWKDLFFERKNESLSKLNSAASVAAGLTIPVFFGIACNQIGHNAVILFSWVPMLICWLIFKFYSRFLNVVGHDKEEKKDS